MIDFDDTPPTGGTGNDEDENQQSDDGRSTDFDDESDSYSVEEDSSVIPQRTDRTLRNTRARRERQNRRPRRNRRRRRNASTQPNDNNERSEGEAKEDEKSEEKEEEEEEEEEEEDTLDPNDVMAETETTVHQEDERVEGESPQTGTTATNNDPNEEIQPEVDHITMTSQSANLRTSKWREGMSRSPNIGGVHMGKIPLDVEVHNTVDMRECIRVKPARNGYMIQSGQMYIPFFKKALKKSRIEHIKEIGLLPAMISNILLPKMIFGNILNSNKKDIMDLIDLIGQIAENFETEVDANDGNNCIRLEFFFKDMIDSDMPQWTFPELDPRKFILLAPQNSFFKTYVACMKEVLVPLKKTFNDNPKLTQYDSLSASAKRMLILCSEMAVEMCEFHPFQGRGIQRINQLWEEHDSSNSDNSQHLFQVLPSLLEVLKEEERLATGLKVGLSYVVYQIKEYPTNHEVANLSAADMKERHRDYIQVYQNNVPNNMKLVNVYLNAMGSIISLLWTPLGLDISEQRRSMFELPTREQLKGLTEHNKEWLIIQITRVVSNCYDLEWWWFAMSKLRKYKLLHGRNDIDTSVRPENFPTTGHTYREFKFARSPLVEDPRTNRPRRKIKNMGK